MRRNESSLAVKSPEKKNRKIQARKFIVDLYNFDQTKDAEIGYTKSRHKQRFLRDILRYADEASNISVFMDMYHIYSRFFFGKRTGKQDKYFGADRLSQKLLNFIVSIEPPPWNKHEDILKEQCARAREVVTQMQQFEDVIILADGLSSAMVRTSELDSTDFLIQQFEKLYNVALDTKADQTIRLRAMRFLEHLKTRFLDEYARSVRDDLLPKLLPEGLTQLVDFYVDVLGEKRSDLFGKNPAEVREIVVRAFTTSAGVKFGNKPVYQLPNHLESVYGLSSERISNHCRLMEALDQRFDLSQLKLEDVTFKSLLENLRRLDVKDYGAVEELLDQFSYLLCRANRELKASGVGTDGEGYISKYLILAVFGAGATANDAEKLNQFFSNEVLFPAKNPSQIEGAESSYLGKLFLAVSNAVQIADKMKLIYAEVSKEPRVSRTVDGTDIDVRNRNADVLVDEFFGNNEVSAAPIFQTLEDDFFHAVARSDGKYYQGDFQVGCQQMQHFINKVKEHCFFILKKYTASVMVFAGIDNRRFALRFLLMPPVFKSLTLAEQRDFMLFSDSLVSSALEKSLRMLTPSPVSDFIGLEKADWKMRINHASDRLFEGPEWIDLFDEKRDLSVTSQLADAKVAMNVVSHFLSPVFKESRLKQLDSSLHGQWEKMQNHQDMLYHVESKLRKFDYEWKQFCELYDKTILPLIAYLKEQVLPTIPGSDSELNTQLKQFIERLEDRHALIKGNYFIFSQLRRGEISESRMMDILVAKEDSASLENVMASAAQYLPKKSRGFFGSAASSVPVLEEFLDTTYAKKVSKDPYAEELELTQEPFLQHKRQATNTEQQAFEDLDLSLFEKDEDLQDTVESEELDDFGQLDLTVFMTEPSSPPPAVSSSPVGIFSRQTVTGFSAARVVPADLGSSQERDFEELDLSLFK